MEENKVFGLETTKYTKLCYILILISSGFSVFSSLMALTGIYISGGVLTGLMGFVGMGLALTALIAYKEKFSSLDVSHFIFLIILFAACITIVFFIGSLLAKLSVLGNIVLFILTVAQFVVLFAGFKLWQTGEDATKENLISSVKSLTSKLKK